MELKDILCRERPKHLYPFMQFLKNEGAINVLQFSLACGKFSLVCGKFSLACGKFSLVCGKSSLACGKSSLC